MIKVLNKGRIPFKKILCLETQYDMLMGMDLEVISRETDIGPTTPFIKTSVLVHPLSFQIIHSNNFILNSCMSSPVQICLPLLQDFSLETHTVQDI